MFALKRHGALNKERTLDSLFGSEEFGGSDGAFWDDEGRRDRLRRSTSFESILAEPKAAEPAVVKVVGSVKNLLLQSKNTFASMNSTRSFAVTQPPINSVAEPKPAQAKVVGSVSHMLLQSKSTIASTSKRSFGAVEQLSNLPKASTYKFNSSGEFKYPSPKKTNQNVFFDLIDKKREKRLSTEKETKTIATKETKSETEEAAEPNSDHKARPTLGPRQQSDSSLYVGSKSKPSLTSEQRLKNNMQIKNSDHSLLQRRSRRRFGVHKIGTSIETSEASSSKVKRIGSDPTLQSRRAPSRNKSDLATQLGQKDKIRPPLSRNKSETNIDGTAPQNTHTRGRRIMIGLVKGEDDDEMHNATVEKHRRRRRLKMEGVERGNHSSRSDFDLDPDDLDIIVDDGVNPEKAEIELNDAFEDPLQKSDHSIDIFDDMDTSNNERKGHRHHKKEKDRHTSHRNSKANSSEKDRKTHRHENKSKTETSTEKLNFTSRHEKMDQLKHKLKAREERKPNGFEMRAHSSCNFEQSLEDDDDDPMERGHFSFDFGSNTFRSSEWKPKGSKPADVQPKSLVDETASLIKLVNALDFPIPDKAEKREEESSLGFDKGGSNHTASSRRRTHLSKTNSRKSLSKKKVDMHDSSSNSFSMSSGSLGSSQNE